MMLWIAAGLLFVGLGLLAYYALDVILGDSDGTD